MKTLFVTVNWVVPYLNQAVFWQHTKKHERMWLSVYHWRVGARVGARQRVRWGDLAQVVVGMEEEWKIGRGRRDVLRGVPEEPKEARLDMNSARESILRKWARH